MTFRRAWLPLLRPPNLFTVPGDVLAGYFLAGGAGVLLFSGLPAMVAAGLFYYAGGLLLNDWADAEADRAERPERPVPAGIVSRPAVLRAALAALALGLVLSLWWGREPLLVGGMLALAIGNYNLLTKHFPLVGPLNMGICRGLNLLLGAVLVAGFSLPPLVWWGGGTLFLYIVAVTHLARSETEGRYWTVERWLPATVLTGSFFLYLLLSPLVEWPGQVAVLVLFVVVVAGAGRTATLLPDRLGLAGGHGAAPPVPALIGRLIALLIPLQAAFVIGAADGLLPLGIGFGLLALWPFKVWLGKVFYSS